MTHHRRSPVDYGRLNGPFKKILTSEQNIYLSTKKVTSFLAPSTGTLWHLSMVSPESHLDGHSIAKVEFESFSVLCNFQGLIASLAIVLYGNGRKFLLSTCNWHLKADKWKRGIKQYLLNHVNKRAFLLHFVHIPIDVSGALAANAGVLTRVHFAI